ncbi:MAG: hypothetical protein QM784_38990 [Polyangiaceae bacterium]
MSASILNARKLIEELQRNPPSADALAVLVDEIARGEGSRLFRSIFDAIASGTADEVAPYEAALRFLDHLAAASPGSAGYLMGRLYSAASRKKLHHLCDGIHLRLCECDSAEAADALTRLADEGGARSAVSNGPVKFDGVEHSSGTGKKTFDPSAP